MCESAVCLLCAVNRRNSIRINSRNWRGHVLFQLWVREGLARHHGFAFAGVVEEDCLDYRCLLEIECVQTVVGIHIGVVGSCVIVHRVLNVLEAGQTDCVK